MSGDGVELGGDGLEVDGAWAAAHERLERLAAEEVRATLDEAIRAAGRAVREQAAPGPDVFPDPRRRVERVSGEVVEPEPGTVTMTISGLPFGRWRRRG